MSFLKNGFVDKIIDQSQKHIKDQANFQNWTGTIAMALSCAAFTGSVALNKGIPSEQKEFLVSQELADGAVNVVLFWVLTDQAKKWADKTIAAGRVFPSELKAKAEQVRKTVGENATFNDMAKHFLPDEALNIKNFHSGFKNGVSLAGSLVAASILTPLIRNVVASQFQKKVDFDKDPVSSEKPVLSQPHAPLVHQAPIVPQRPFVPHRLPPKPQGFQARSGLSI